jgi:hypothetical protein
MKMDQAQMNYSVHEQELLVYISSPSTECCVSQLYRCPAETDVEDPWRTQIDTSPG